MGCCCSSIAWVIVKAGDGIELAVTAVAQLINVVVHAFIDLLAGLFNCLAAWSPCCRVPYPKPGHSDSHHYRQGPPEDRPTTMALVHSVGKPYRLPPEVTEKEAKRLKEKQEKAAAKEELKKKVNEEKKKKSEEEKKKKTEKKEVKVKEAKEEKEKETKNEEKAWNGNEKDKENEKVKEKEKTNNGEGAKKKSLWKRFSSSSDVKPAA